MPCIHDAPLAEEHAASSFRAADASILRVIYHDFASRKDKLSFNEFASINGTQVAATGKEVHNKGKSVLEVLRSRAGITAG